VAVPECGYACGTKKLTHGNDNGIRNRKNETNLVGQRSLKGSSEIT
jgi:hypothetical protein